MSKSNNRKKRSASGVSYSSKKSPSDNHDSKGTEDLSKERDEKEYKISTILDDWKKIVGFYVACIAVCSAFNIGIWSLLSSGFNIKVSAYLLSHGMGGGAVSFQPIVIMQILNISSIIIFFTWKNILHSLSLEKPVEIFFAVVALTSAVVLFLLSLSMFLEIFNTPAYPLWVLNISLISHIVLTLGEFFVIIITIFTADKIRDFSEKARKHPISTTIGIPVCVMGFALSGLIVPVSMYYTGYGTECFKVSKNSVSDKVVKNISDSNITDDYKNKIRESLGESWSVHGEEVDDGMSLYLFVTREDKDTIDGVLFKKGKQDMRTEGKIITINRKTIEARGSQVCPS